LELVNWNIILFQNSCILFKVSHPKKILSFVEYGISAWGRNKSPEIKKISLLQKRAVRITENAKTASHTDPLFF